MNENFHFPMQIIYIKMLFCKVSLRMVESASYKMYYCCCCYCYYLIKSAVCCTHMFYNLNSET